MAGYGEQIDFDVVACDVATDEFEVIGSGCGSDARSGRSPRIAARCAAALGLIFLLAVRIPERAGSGTGAAPVLPAPSATERPVPAPSGTSGPVPAAQLGRQVLTGRLPGFGVFDATRSLDPSTRRLVAMSIQASDDQGETLELTVSPASGAPAESLRSTVSATTVTYALTVVTASGWRVTVDVSGRPGWPLPVESVRALARDPRLVT